VATNDYNRNRILQLLPASDAERLGRILEPVRINFKELIYTAGKPMEYVYFPLTSVASLVIDMEGGQSVEAGTIGREGLLGLTAFLGSRRSVWRALSQIAGDALRAPVDAFREEALRIDSLNQLLRRYTIALMAMLAQTAACNRLHSLEERMCRWLLMTRDRVDSDQFPLTQEFLGQMLGVRRPSVSLTGAALQSKGLIRYTRGQIAISDRAGLEAAACECYRVVKRHYEEAVVYPLVEANV
jgi:CRP-like cAMP-binding protein